MDSTQFFPPLCRGTEHGQARAVQCPNEQGHAQGEIFIDWLLNEHGSTAVVPYSARAPSGAPVAVPIGWNELKDMADAHLFSIDDAKRLRDREVPDLFRGLLRRCSSHSTGEAAKGSAGAVELAPAEGLILQPAGRSPMSDDRWGRRRQFRCRRQ